MQTPNWQQIRQNYPAFQKMTYFDTARCGILSKQTAELGHRFYQQYLEEGPPARERWIAEIPIVRQKVADCLGAKPHEMTLLPNCATGINYAAQMLRSHHKKVLLLSEDYLTVRFPWLVNHYEIFDFLQLPNGSVDIEALQERILKEKIEVVAVSYVQFSSGYKIDLKTLGAFCRENGVVLVVDATQAFGAMPIDVEVLKVDILVASTFKWACAGFGTGFMYVRAVFFEVYDPPVMGAESQGIAVKIKHISEIDFSGYTFQTGNYDYKSVMVLGTAIDQLLAVGLAQIKERIAALQAYLLLQLQKIDISLVSDYGSDNRAGITIIEGNQALWDFMKSHGVLLSLRGKGIRISPHFYNTFEEIDALCDLFQRF
ncbi:MAG: aminotransferase class V-fold PLP-dependent enzyme [Chitinophagales bacterium]